MQHHAQRAWLLWVKLDRVDLAAGLAMSVMPPKATAGRQDAIRRNGLGGDIPRA